MDDITFMPIVKELFDTLPEWDVPELNLEPGKTYFFRDSRSIHVVRIRDGAIKRYQADFMKPRQYEDAALPIDPFTTPLNAADLKVMRDELWAKMQADFEAEIYAVPNSPPQPGSASPQDIAEPVAKYQINYPGKLIVATAGTYEAIEVEPVANAIDGSSVPSEPPLKTYAIDREDFDALPEWTPFEGPAFSYGLFRDGGQIVQRIHGIEKRFIADFGKIPF